MKGQGRCYLFTKAVFSVASILGLLSLSPWSKGGNTCPSVHFWFSGLLARAFELVHTGDQIYPKPAYLTLFIQDHDQDPTKEKTKLYDKKKLSPYWVKDKVVESLCVAAAARYARLQWDHLLVPMCHRGSAQQFDMRYGNVAVKSSEKKTYTAWKEDFLRCERQKMCLLVSCRTEKCGVLR